MERPAVKVAGSRPARSSSHDLRYAFCMRSMHVLRERRRLSGAARARRTAVPCINRVGCSEMGHPGSASLPVT